MALRAEDKLTLIRTYMEEKGLDALIVPPQPTRIFPNIWISIMPLVNG